MSPEATLAIGGAVGTASKFLMMSGVRGRWATLAAVALSSAVMAIWGYSSGDYNRQATWSYFVTWLNMLTVAAGSFHATEEVVKKMNEGKE